MFFSYLEGFLFISGISGFLFCATEDDRKPKKTRKTLVLIFKGVNTFDAIWNTF